LAFLKRATRWNVYVVDKTNLANDSSIDYEVAFVFKKN
jgi:hypothetical protein